MLGEALIGAPRSAMGPLQIAMVTPELERPNAVIAAFLIASPPPDLPVLLVPLALPAQQVLPVFPAALPPLKWEPSPQALPARTQKSATAVPPKTPCWILSFPKVPPDLPGLPAPQALREPLGPRASPVLPA